jgi:hypothetical protein
MTVRVGKTRPSDPLVSSGRGARRGRARRILRPEPPAGTDPPELCTRVTGRRTTAPQVFPAVRVVFTGGGAAVPNCGLGKAPPASRPKAVEVACIVSSRRSAGKQSGRRLRTRATP